MVDVAKRGAVVAAAPALHRRALTAAHVAAALVALTAVLAQVVRPVAPDLGPPPDPSRWFDDAFLSRAHAYSSPLYALGLVALTVRLLVPAVAAYTRPGRRAAHRVVAAIGEHRPARAAAVVAVALVVLTDLVLLPAAFWAGYSHEGAYGHRTQGLGGWAYDWAVAHALGWLVAAALTLVGYWLARRLPRAWPAVGGLGAGAASALVVFAAPLLLEPLWLDTSPLPPGPVRAEIEEVLARAGEPVGAILVADASRRTTKLNAYVSGLGATRRVVLFDTLVERAPPAQVGLVVAHELGHRRNADVARGVALAAGGTVAAAYVLAWLLGARVRAGRQTAQADPRAVAVVVATVVALNVASLPLQALVSRRAEAAADLAALDLTRDAPAYLAMNEALARANLSEPAPPRWAYLLWFSHPPVASRLEMGERWPDLTLRPRGG